MAGGRRQRWSAKSAILLSNQDLTLLTCLFARMFNADMTFRDISALDLECYRATARKRWQQTQQQALHLQEHAWQVARQAAAILREQFGVTEVIVFGSLARGDLLHAHSDVDLAVSGLDERQYYRAIGRIQSVDPVISVDLVRLEDASHALRTIIQQEGSIIT